MRVKAFLLPAVACCAWFCASAPAESKVVKVKIRVDSQAPGYEGFRAMDGNPATMWHTEFGFAEPPHPHEIIVDLGESYEISGFTYLPRPDGGNGTIRDYECYVSDNNKEFGKPIAKGAISKGTGESQVLFPAKQKGRYVRLRALSEVAARP